MTIILTFLVNAGANFALGLLVAKFLGPEDFGRYAVAFSIAVVLNTLLFEWLRLSATRFYSERSRADDPGIRATLDLGYAITAAGLALLFAGALLLRIDLALPTVLLLAAAGAGLGLAWFDYHAAIARARFADRTYAGLVVVKNLTALLLMAGGAYLFKDPALVLAGAALSALVPTMVARRCSLDDGSRRAQVRRDLFARYARYALPLIGASCLYQFIPFANRSLLAAQSGFAEAGYFSLAADLGIRVFATLGSALDILLFQIAVRTDEASGRAEAERQIARNLGIVVAMVAPAMAGFWVVLPAFEAVFVPLAYKGAFAAYTTVLLPALAAFALIQYGFNPVFQLRQRTGPVIVAALAAVIGDAVLLAILPQTMGPLGYAAAQFGGMTCAVVMLLVLVMQAGIALPWRDLGGSALAAGVMTLLLLPLRNGGLPPAVVLTGGAALGACIYGGLAVALDLGGCRALATRIFSTRLAHLRRA